MELLNSKGTIQSKEQRLDTMLEQINIRKAQLNQRLLQRKTEEEDLNERQKCCQKEYEDAKSALDASKHKEEEYGHKAVEWKNKRREAQNRLTSSQDDYNKLSSKLEALKNIAERYDGYGNSIRKVMEQKDSNPGIIGVVSDLIHVEKKYEIAIETALSGNIQNIVTEGMRQTAKKMITYLKENRLGTCDFPATGPAFPARALPRIRAFYPIRVCWGLPTNWWRQMQSMPMFFLICWDV